MSQTGRKKILSGELIGRDVEVLQSANVSLRGLQGKIVNETKMTITIRHQGKKKMLLKNSITININGTVVPGKELVGRPEERIKWLA